MLVNSDQFVGNEYLEMNLNITKFAEMQKQVTKCNVKEYDNRGLGNSIVVNGSNLNKLKTSIRRYDIFIVFF